MTAAPAPVPSAHDIIRDHPTDTADILASLDESEALNLLRRLVETGRAVPAIENMDPENAARLLAGMQRDDAVGILTNMAPDDAVDLLAELPEDTLRDILGRLDRKDSLELTELLHYKPDTAGGLMTPDAIAIPATLTVRETVEHLRRKADEAETVYYAYVIDHAGVLQGVLRLRDLIFAPPDSPIRSLLIEDVVALPVDMELEEIAALFRRHSYLALPVTDAKRRLLGIVTVDDVMSAVRREFGEDMLRMGGIPGGEEAPLAPPLVSVRKRLPWMMGNVVFDLIAVIGVAFFEDTIAQVAFLAVLMPIISDMGGNLATQAAAVAIRGMSMGQVDWTDLSRVVRKEFRVGIINGVVLGAQLGLIAYIWKGNGWLGLVATVSLWLNAILATIIGGAFPLLAKRMKLDPAMMTGAVVTTVTDLTGFFLFLGLATLVIDRLI